MGKRAWLTQFLSDEILPAIAQLDDSPEGREKCQHFAQLLRDRWVEQGKTSLKQQQGLMDQTRRALKDAFGEEHFSLNYIGFSREESFELNRQKQGNARDRQLQQRYLHNPDAIVAKAVALLESPEWAEVACGLAVVTGRRLNEVLKTGEFKVKSQWIVTFQGALKRRGETVPLVFDIPVLTTAHRVIQAVEKLRRITPTDANENQVAIVSDHQFAELVPAPAGKDRLYSHLWRSVFCCIATFWYCPKHVDDLLFKAHIMGHFETLTEDEKLDDQKRRQRLETFSSERHYRLYEIEDELIAYHKGKRKGIKLGIGGIVPLDAFVSGLPEHQPQSPERKHRSSLRMWREDHDAVAQILGHFEGNTQPDRVHAWIQWTLQQLASAPSAIEPEAIEPAGETPSVAIKQNRLQNHTTFDDIDQLEASADQSESSLDPVATSSQPSTAVGGLEAKLDKLVDVMAEFMQFQMRLQQATLQAAAPAPASSTKAVISQSVSTVQPTKATPKERTATPPATEEPTRENKPRKYKTGEADATINAAINAIMQHNNQPDQQHDLKWAITINGLKNFSANQRAIERIIHERREEIEQHHQQHQIQPGHNNRHKRKRKVAEVIQI